MNTEVAVIIPTMDNLEMLEPLVKQLKGFDVYIVDDGQHPGTVKWLKQQRDINCIFHKENKGIAISWNDGIRAAMKDGHTYFAIFNDDIVLPDSWWPECKAIFDQKAHLVCLKTECPLSGWFFLLDKYCIDKIGLFDESIISYKGEDDEYIARFRKRMLVKGIVDLDVYHYGSKTLKKLQV